MITKLVPELENWDASVKTMVVVDEFIAPFKVVVLADVSSPPQDPKPHPKPFACTAGPTG